jgi:CRISPR/Cas system-associated exonuclease Cas4 (RecB family)
MKIAASKIDENPAQAGAVVSHVRWYLSRPREGIHVSDLLFPRRAYFSRKHPEVELTEEEVGRFIAGRGHHQIIQALTTSPEFREVPVRWEGISGHIDIYKEVPVEIKTTRAMKVAAKEELSPHYIEQLGMYCALANVKRGQLLLLHLGIREAGKQGMTPKLVVYDAAFDHLDAIRREMLERKDALVKALEGDDPKDIIPCPEWMCDGCKYAEFCRVDQSKKTTGG